MDLLKRRHAPIPSEAFAEIDERAREVIASQLSARKILKVDGPHGLAKTSVDTGTHEILQQATESTVGTAIYGVDPLVEGRVVFELSRWELDDILRGKEDVELDALENAAERLALFEENAVFNGFERAALKGIVEYAKKPLKMTKEPASLLQAVAEGILKLEDAFAEKPYGLFVDDEVFKALNQSTGGKLLRSIVEEMIGGPVVRAKSLEGALLVPYDHDDLRLYVGQDYAVGYEKHDNETVTLFMTVSFLFKCYDEDIIVRYELTDD